MNNSIYSEIKSKSSSTFSLISSLTRRYSDKSPGSIFGGSSKLQSSNMDLFFHTSFSPSSLLPHPQHEITMSKSIGSNNLFVLSRKLQLFCQYRRFSSIYYYFIFSCSIISFFILFFYYDSFFTYYYMCVHTLPIIHIFSGIFLNVLLVG